MSDPAFLALRFDIEAADGDRWTDALLAAGAMSVDASDPRTGSVEESAVFAETDNEAPSWWPITRLTALCATRADASAIVAGAANAIARAVPAFEIFAVPGRDWVLETRSQFGPIRVAEDFYIVPSWCESPRASALNVALDPGLAFGTGAHPTTQLCLRWIREHVRRGDAVLDYGCGSGILAVAAAKLGADRVVGTDIDPLAIRAGADNARLNGVDVRFLLVDALPREPFSIVVANILANPLRLLAPALAARTAIDGRIALSGILVAQAGEVVDAYRPWFDLTVWQRDGEWVLLSGTRQRITA